MSSFIHSLLGFDSIRLGWALVHFLWQGLVLVLLLEAALIVAGRKNASLRYLLCALALLAMPACLMDTYLALGQPSVAGAPPVASTGMAVVGSASSQAGYDHFAFLPVVHTITEFTSREIPHFELNRWLPGMVWCWLGGVLLLAGRKMSGFVVLEGLRRRGISTPSDAMLELCRSACLKMGVNPRCVYLGVSNLVEVPMTMGWLRPIILFPAALMSGLSTNEIEFLLAHELAHIRRGDYLANLVQTLVETLFFYHPATWWISRRMRQERENCCDDLVTKSSNEVSAYAQVLYRLETLRLVGVGSLASAASGGSLLQRIRRLSGEPAPRSGSGLPMLVALISVLGMIAAGTLLKAKTGEGASWAKSAASDSTKLSPGDSAPAGLTIVYQDNFGRTGELEGTSPGVVNKGGAAWMSSTGAGQYVMNGGSAAMSLSAYSYSLAYLPVNGGTGIVLDGSKDFTLSVAVKPGSMGRTGISLNTGSLTRYSNLFTNSFATLSTSSSFAGAYAFNRGNIGYNYAPGITGMTTISLNYRAAAHTLTYLVGSTTVFTQTGVTADQVSAIRYVGFGDDGFGGNAGTLAPTFDNFTFSVGSDGRVASTSTATPTPTNKAPASS